MKLSRNQQIALLFLNHWDSHEWSSVDAALVMCGVKCPHGIRSCEALEKLGLVIKVIPRLVANTYSITDKGRKVAKTLSLSVTITEAKP